MFAKMRSLVILATLAVAAMTIPAEFFNANYEDFDGDFEYDGMERDALPCNITDCKLPACYCTPRDIPGGLSPNNTPQVIKSTFRHCRPI
jgi:hypothetical protein